MSGRDRSRTLSSDEHVLLGHAKMISNMFNYYPFVSSLLVEARASKRISRFLYDE
jgi:hypothetical protein